MLLSNILYLPFCSDMSDHYLVHHVLHLLSFQDLLKCFQCVPLDDVVKDFVKYRCNLFLLWLSIILKIFMACFLQVLSFLSRGLFNFSEMIQFFCYEAYTEMPIFIWLLVVVVSFKFVSFVVQLTFQTNGRWQLTELQ